MGPIGGSIRMANPSFLPPWEKNVTKMPHRCALLGKECDMKNLEGLIFMGLIREGRNKIRARMSVDKRICIVLVCEYRRRRGLEVVWK